MNIKFPVRLVDDKFLVGADHELISELPEATEEEREEIVRTMNTGAAAEGLLKALKECKRRLELLIERDRHKLLDVIAVEEANKALAKAGEPQ